MKTEHGKQLMISHLFTSQASCCKTFKLFRYPICSISVLTPRLSNAEDSDHHEVLAVHTFDICVHYVIVRPWLYPKYY